MKPLHCQSRTQHLFQQYSGEDILIQLLKARGVEDVQTFLTLPHSVLHDSFQLKHIDKGIACLAKHLNQQSQIAILVDSDMDGVTSAAIIWKYLKHISGRDCLYFVHSGKQHGLTPEIMEQVLASDCRLLITPDSSSNDVEACHQLKEAGIDVLILDHHEIERDNPYAIVINNQDGQYPNKTLVGAGVVYKFIQAFNRTYQLEVPMEEYLALTALALIADMAWLGNPESRLLTLEGLKRVHLNDFARELCEKQAYSMNNQITIGGISWYVAPLVNATIRLGGVEDKQDLFKAFIGHEETVTYKPRKSAKNPHPVEETQTFQQAMVRRCLSFKNKQSTETKKGVAKLVQHIEQEGLDQHKLLIVRGDELKSTFTGLVANKLSQQYKRPCFVIRHQHPDQPYVGGSARNYSKSPIHDLKAFVLDSQLMEFAQGHAQSFGLRIQADHIPLLLNYVDQQLEGVAMEDIHHVDAELPIRQLKERDVLAVGAWDTLWGGGLERPKFFLTDIYLMSEDIQLVGEKKNMIRFIVEQGTERFTFIKFFASETLYNQLIHRHAQGFSSTKGKRLKLSVIGEFKVNHYNGEDYPQIEILEIQSEEVKHASYF